MSLRRTLAATFAAATAATIVTGPAVATAAPSGEPSIQAIKQIASGLNQAWSIDFLPDGTGLFTQKDAKTISKIDKAGKVTTVQTIPGVSIDELNKIEPGKNYGWPTCEGPCNTSGMTNPVETWPTSSASPSGLAYYKNSLYMAALKGGTYKMTLSGSGGKIFTNLGRTRDEVAGPDGRLYTITPGAIYTSDGS
jgi:glucose/arabinose dehydrogenase